MSVNNSLTAAAGHLARLRHSLSQVVEGTAGSTYTDVLHDSAKLGVDDCDRLQDRLSYLERKASER